MRNAKNRKRKMVSKLPDNLNFHSKKSGIMLVKWISNFTLSNEMNEGVTGRNAEEFYFCVTEMFFENTDRQTALDVFLDRNSEGSYIIGS